MSQVRDNYWLSPGVLSWFELAKDYARFARGYTRFLLTRHHDWGAFFALRRLFCATNGRLNDAISQTTRIFSRPDPVPTTGSLIPKLTAEQIAQVVRDLDKDGFHIFEHRLSDNICDQLATLARRTPSTVMKADGTTLPDPCLIELQNPQGIKYNAPMEAIMQAPVAQRVVGDPGLLAIAQSYFRAKAVQDMVAMWWSLPASEANPAAAQLYHFDMDRIKFLKFFLYLDDVGPTNGPHCFIRGSHRRLPRPLRLDKRHTDEAVFHYFPHDREVIITGLRGTLVAEDTRGLHKGMPLSSGHRLIFQVEFALNLFGMQYPMVPLGTLATPFFRQMMARYPYTYAPYL